MQYSISLILVLIATIINSIVFGYVGSNSKNNKASSVKISSYVECISPIISTVEVTISETFSKFP